MCVRRVANSISLKFFRSLALDVTRSPEFAISSLLVVTSLLFGCVLMPQDKGWGSYDRLVVTEKFLNAN
jgi:hypothetical protein